MVYHMPECRDFSSFLLSAELSDVTIQYEDGLLPVHKIILAQASEYFKTLLTGPFAEAGQRIVELIDDPPMAIEGMIAWIYGMQFNPRDRYNKYIENFHFVTSDETGVEFVKYQVDLFFTAEKYLLSRLATSVEGYFFHMLLDVSRQVEFLHVIAKHVYIARAEEAVALRVHVANAYLERIRSIKDTEELKQLLLDIPELAFDIIRAGATLPAAEEEDDKPRKVSSGSGAFPPLPRSR
ncbi:uncharacterized protein CLAFUR5_05469 [Fulvia fulva]|uniref:BTB domain-containing protein n=1 Tax=Passalora fulva TaxID=5499 RepID=A0A9Q8LJ20_PASFU|nr:uncharacterized protein CLAFUR5_05469 [Fulvia fulva]KAK4625895.1 hypothetical protein CLAFUR0_05323 [Fulvia fulva]UJO18295.1 hypothetical protein CLAFUR5_05469 [Fulvia fulva]